MQHPAGDAVGGGGTLGEDDEDVQVSLEFFVVEAMTAVMEVDGRGRCVKVRDLLPSFLHLSVHACVCVSAHRRVLSVCVKWWKR